MLQRQWLGNIPAMNKNITSIDDHINGLGKETMQKRTIYYRDKIK